MPKIYESPDGGATIYEREIGEPYRTLVKENNWLLNKMSEDKMWGEIRRMAETNPAMREYTDKCIELYHLLKETK
jgi:hypothetical protein